jgi:hypothetical protein
MRLSFGYATIGALPFLFRLFWVASLVQDLWLLQAASSCVSVRLPTSLPVSFRLLASRKLLTVFYAGFFCALSCFFDLGFDFFAG